MLEIPTPEENRPADSTPPETTAEERAKDNDTGDFIARQILEKDTVFFEG